MRTHHVALALLALGGGLASALPAQDGASRYTDLHPLAARFAAQADDHEDERPRLGVTVNVTEDGLVVTEVAEGSIAERARLATGDVLHRINGVVVTSVEDVAKGLAASQDGVHTLSVIREGEGLVTRDVEPVRERRAERERFNERRAAPRDAAPRDGAPRLELRRPEGGDLRRLELAPAPGGGGGFFGVNLGGGTDQGGVLVAGVIPNSAAWFVGLEEGDVLLSIDGDAVSTPDDVVASISGKPAGTFIKVSYLRDGEKHKVKARLGSRVPTGALGMLSPGNNELRFGLPQFQPGGMVMELDGGDLTLDLHDLHEHLGQLQGRLDLSELHEHLDGPGLQGLHEHLEHLEKLHELGDQGGNMLFLGGEDGGPRMRLHKRKGGAGIGGGDRGPDFRGRIDGLLREHGVETEGAGDVSISIADGVLTITRDGETETIELDEDFDGVLSFTRKVESHGGDGDGLYEDDSF